MTTTTTTGGGRTIGTNTFGEIINLDDTPIEDFFYDETGEEGGGLNWVLVAVVVILIAAVVLVVFWKFDMFQSLFKKKKNTPEPSNKPTIPRQMPATTHGGPVMPNRPAQQKPRQYSPHLKKSLSELAKKYTGPTIGGKPAASSKPKKTSSGSKTARPTTQTTTTTTKPLQKPLERLSKPQPKKPTTKTTTSTRKRTVTKA